MTFFENVELRGGLTLPSFGFFEINSNLSYVSVLKSFFGFSVKTIFLSSSVMNVSDLATCGVKNFSFSVSGGVKNFSFVGSILLGVEESTVANFLCRKDLAELMVSDFFDWNIDGGRSPKNDFGLPIFDSLTLDKRGNGILVPPGFGIRDCSYNTEEHRKKGKNYKSP